MKKNILNSVFLLSMLLAFTACDFVQNVNPPLEPSNGNGSASNIFISDSTTNSDPSLRKALVEDYTGHKCGNCPAAADQLSTLETQYPGKIVPLAIHAGFFAQVNPLYPTDFRNTAGDAYDTQFGVSNVGNPNGLVNRVGYGTGSFIKAYTIWGTEISNQTALTPKFQLLIKYKYDTGNAMMTTEVKVKSLANNTGTYKVAILLTEDSVIAEQLDYRIQVPPAPSQKKSDYQFNHLLRGAINSEWGAAVFTGGAILNTTETVLSTNYQINSSYKKSKCHILAYIYDADPASPTFYEVLQVEELQLK